MLLLMLRGTPTIYYGDEIGMVDVAISPDQIRDPLEKNVPGIGVGRRLRTRCNGTPRRMRLLPERRGCRWPWTLARRM
jgi:glycosidase